MKLTRRQLMVAAGSAASVSALAQSPQAPPQAPADAAKEAGDNLRRNADALATFPLPMAVEPAFQFKA
jgi:hypothetical protein